MASARAASRQVGRVESTAVPPRTACSAAPRRSNSGRPMAMTTSLAASGGGARGDPRRRRSRRRARAGARRRRAGGGDVFDRAWTTCAGGPFRNDVTGSSDQHRRAAGAGPFPIRPAPVDRTVGPPGPAHAAVARAARQPRAWLNWPQMCSGCHVERLARGSGVGRARPRSSRRRRAPRRRPRSRGGSRRGLVAPGRPRGDERAGSPARRRLGRDRGAAAPWRPDDEAGAAVPVST